MEATAAAWKGQRRDSAQISTSSVGISRGALSEKACNGRVDMLNDGVHVLVWVNYRPHMLVVVGGKHVTTLDTHTTLTAHGLDRQ